MGTTANQRMKPPLTKFRLGDYFGKLSQELTGFINSINYTVPEESTWRFENQKRAPKYIIATITYQVIPDSVPGLGTVFYGYGKADNYT